MKVLVFGGNGFIGSHLVDNLLANGHFVRIFDRDFERYRAPLSNVDYRQATFGDTLEMAKALENIDIVYHLISTTVPSTSNLDPVSDIYGNLIGTVRLLDQMVQSEVKRIVFLSSGGTVYGDTNQMPISEGHPVRPICSYGIIKAAIENYLYMYQKLYGISPLILRPSNAYGPRQGRVGIQGVIFTILSKVKANQPIIIWGDGSTIRDYLYVSDLVKLCLVAGLSKFTGVFNAGSSQGHSINEIINIISAIFGFRLDVLYEKGRPFDIKEIVLDSSEAKNNFGWEAETPLEEGIRRTWLWINEQGNTLEIDNHRNLNSASHSVQKIY